MNLEWRKADIEQLPVIYDWMKKQFDPKEIKPLSAIQSLHNHGHYKIETMLLDDELAGYLLTAFDDPDRGQLIDYLAVLPDRQDQGIGSAMLRAVKEHAEGGPIFLEVEDPDRRPNEQERAIALRRIVFYKRNGLRMTDIRLNLFDVDFCIMAMEEEGATPDAVIRARLEEVYHTFFPDFIYKRKVHFR